ncbi:MAG: UpxY family transcription antiterminator [Candidatus Acidiferrales bacterium]
MASATVPFHPARQNFELAVGYQEPCWYAAYTNANHEKRVAAQFAGRGVEHFLPLYATVHRWKDRRMRLDLPLFPSYIFVHLPLRERLRVLEVPGVVRLVGFGEHAASLPAEEIEMLRNGLNAELHAQPHPYLTAGRRMRIVNGPLAGMEGILMRKKSNFRLILSINLIMRSIVVDVDAADIRPLDTPVLVGRTHAVEFKSAGLLKV